MNKVAARLEAARIVGDLLREERRADDQSLAKVLAASERDFEAMLAAAQEPGLFERMVVWLKALELPGDLFLADLVAARDEASVRKLADEVPGETSLAATTGAEVEIAFENHHSEAVWVVACERGEDGSVSFVPEKDLAEASRVAPGDALTFTFTPTSPTTMQVVAIALRSQPSGDPAEVLAEPSRLQEFGIVATARFKLRVSTPAR